jgi:hypothetical protein
MLTGCARNVMICKYDKKSLFTKTETIIQKTQ